MNENKLKNQLEEFENEELANDKLTSAGKKHVIDLLDAVFVLIFAFSLHYIAFFFTSLSSFIQLFSRFHFLVLALFVLYRVLFFALFGKTLAMFALQTYYCKPRKKHFSLGDKLLAAFMIYRNGLSMYNK